MARKTLFTLATCLPLLALVACKEPEREPKADSSAEASEAQQVIASPAPPPAPEPIRQPMGYDQAVRCAYLAERAVSYGDGAHGMTIDQLATLQARAREAAYAAAPREGRSATIDADMNELLRQAAISAPRPMGSGYDEESNRRIEREWEARRTTQNAELKGVCAQLTR